MPYNFSSLWTARQKTKADAQKSLTTHFFLYPTLCLLDRINRFIGRLIRFWLAWTYNIHTRVREYATLILLVKTYYLVSEKVPTVLSRVFVSDSPEVQHWSILYSRYHRVHDVQKNWISNWAAIFPVYIDIFSCRMLHFRLFAEFFISDFRRWASRTMPLQSKS